MSDLVSNMEGDRLFMFLDGSKVVAYVPSTKTFVDDKVLQETHGYKVSGACERETGKPAVCFQLNP